MSDSGAKDAWQLQVYGFKGNVFFLNLEAEGSHPEVLQCMIAFMIYDILFPLANHCWQGEAVDTRQDRNRKGISKTFLSHKAPTGWADYNMTKGSMICCLFRFPGGMLNRKINPSLPRSDECCMITFENFKENGVTVLKMPCGHSMCPDALMDYAWSEVSTNKKTEVKCPLCAREWTIDIIRKYGGATPTEMSQLELGISQNFFTSSSDINQCPKCKTYCTRQDPKNNCVRCVICSREQNSSYHFCFLWLEELPFLCCLW